jgi:hypothetical protein
MLASSFGDAALILLAKASEISQGPVTTMDGGNGGNAGSSFLPDFLKKSHPKSGPVARSLSPVAFPVCIILRGCINKSWVSSIDVGVRADRSA